jgi:hypothetical protein
LVFVFEVVSQDEFPLVFVDAESLVAVFEPGPVGGFTPSQPETARKRHRAATSGKERLARVMVGLPSNEWLFRQ